MTARVLGLDTSNYTTSAAIVSFANGLEGEERVLLSVKPGEKGLRQSEALFQHVKNLPDVVERLLPSGSTINAVAASTRPRPQEGSYMPVFLAGESLGRSLAAVLGVPFFSTSHQEGHLEAGFQSSVPSPGSDMIGMHVSGGTSELVRATRHPGRWDVTLLGGSTDLNAGQFIDRVGQALGLAFPAGPALEELAADGQQGRVTIPAPVSGYGLSFSGPATAALRAIEQGAAPADVALAVLLCVARGVEKIVARAVKSEGRRDVLLVGGVMSNTIIRNHLKEKLEHPATGAVLYFAATRLSSDNAAGVAYLGLQRLKDAEAAR